MSIKNLRVADRDEQIIRNIQRGGLHQERGLEEVNKNPQARSAVRRMVLTNGGRDESDVNAIFNEGLVALRNKVLQLTESDISNFKLWAYLLVCCRYIWIRESKNRKSLLKKMQHLADYYLKPHNTLAKYLTEKDKENLFLVENLIDELPETDRWILLLHEMKYTLKDIAIAVGITEANAKIKKHRAKNKLIKAMENDDNFKEIF